MKRLMAILTALVMIGAPVMATSWGGSFDSQNSQGSIGVGVSEDKVDVFQGFNWDGDSTGNFGGDIADGDDIRDVSFSSWTTGNEDFQTASQFDWNSGNIVADYGFSTDNSNSYEVGSFGGITDQQGYGGNPNDDAFAHSFQFKSLSASDFSLSFSGVEGGSSIDTGYLQSGDFEVYSQPNTRGSSFRRGLGSWGSNPVPQGEAVFDSFSESFTPTYPSPDSADFNIHWQT